MTTSAAPGRLGRAGWMAVGFGSVGLGSLGIIVPGLPTTVFFIVAAWCFSRSSPRFEQWILELPRIGPLVQDHRAGLGMPIRAKQYATGTIALAVTFSSVTLRNAPVIVAVVLALAAIGVATIWWRVPTREHVLARTGEVPSP
ncbi:MAG: YbaN family protein [Acidimicrobiales bacterium]